MGEKVFVDCVNGLEGDVWLSEVYPDARADFEPDGQMCKARKAG